MQKILEKDFWDKYLKVYDVLSNLIPYRQTLQDILDLINSTSNSTVLDVGCGTGNIIKLFIDIKKEFSSIVGIDSSDVALKIAKEKIHNRNVVFNLVNLNSALPLLDNEFDYLIMNNVLHSIQVSDRLRLFKELFRITKPGGKIIVATVNDHFSPIDIYRKHISLSIKRKGFIQTIIETLRYIYPSLLIMIYNYQIKMSIRSKKYNLLSKDEHGLLLKNAGFDVELDNYLTYSGNSFLAVGVKNNHA